MSAFKEKKMRASMASLWIRFRLLFEPMQTAIQGLEDGWWQVMKFKRFKGKVYWFSERFEPVPRRRRTLK